MNSSVSDIVLRSGGDLPRRTANANPARDMLARNKQVKTYKVKNGKILRSNFSISDFTASQAHGVT